MKELDDMETRMPAISAAEYTVVRDIKRIKQAAQLGAQFL